MNQNQIEWFFNRNLKKVETDKLHSLFKQTEDQQGPKAKELYVKVLNELLSRDAFTGNPISDDQKQQDAFFDLSTLFNKEFPPTEWLVESLVPMNGLVVVAGAPGSYKSWIVEHMALAVSTGTSLFGKFPTQEGGVLIIDQENHLSLVQKRFRLLGGVEGMEIYFYDADFFVEDEDTVAEVCNMIQDNSIKLVIIDSLIRSYRNKDENSSNDMAEVFRQFRKFQQAGASVVFVHHHRKPSILSKNIASESLRGSSDILAAVDSAIAVEKDSDQVNITQTKLRQDMAIKPFKVKLGGDSEHLEFVYCGELEEEAEKVDKAKEEIQIVLEEGEFSRVDLISRFKGIYGQKTIDSALKSFASDEVQLRLGERGKKYYRKAGEDLFSPESQSGNTYI